MSASAAKLQLVPHDRIIVHPDKRVEVQEWMIFKKAPLQTISIYRKGTYFVVHLEFPECGTNCRYMGNNFGEFAEEIGDDADLYRQLFELEEITLEAVRAIGLHHEVVFAH